MATKRFIPTNIWTENPYFAALSSAEKVLFLYLWSNQDIEYYGTTDYFPEKVAHETAMKVSHVVRILKKFANDNIVIIEQYKLFVQGFVKVQGPVNPRTLNRFRAEKHKLPTRIRKAVESELEGGSVAGSERGSLGGSESPSQLTNNKKELISNTEFISEKKESKNFENNNNQPVVAIGDEKGIQTVFQNQSEENINLFQQHKEDVPSQLSALQQDLVERIARAFKDTFGWKGDPFAEKHFRHFFAAAQKVIQLAKDPKYHYPLIDRLMEGLKCWSTGGDTFEHPKTISPGHLASEYIWETVVPQFADNLIVFEEPEQDEPEYE